MSDEKLVVISEFDNPMEANIVKGMLEENGIPAGVINDSTAGALLYGTKYGTAKVIVHESNREAAIELIANAQGFDEE